eukprot:756227-Hanusia_phi.AAC.1
MHVTKIYLLVPFDERNIAKEHKAKWDPEEKLWYCLKTIPKELEKYEMTYVDIPYDEKDEYKEKYKSLRWDKNAKSWICSLEEYNMITG